MAATIIRTKIECVARQSAVENHLSLLLLIRNTPIGLDRVRYGSARHKKRGRIAPAPFLIFAWISCPSQDRT